MVFPQADFKSLTLTKALNLFWSTRLMLLKWPCLGARAARTPREDQLRQIGSFIFVTLISFEYLSLSLEPLLCSSLSGAAADKSPPGILIGQIATDYGCQGVLKTMLPQTGGSFLLWLHHHCCAAPFGAHPDFSKEPSGLCVGQLPRVGLLLLLDKWLKPRFSFLVWVAANTAATVAGNCPQRTACMQMLRQTSLIIYMRKPRVKSRPQCQKVLVMWNRPPISAGNANLLFALVQRFKFGWVTAAAPKLGGSAEASPL